MVFQNTFISSIMSRNRFLQIFYNLHLADNSLEPKRGSREYSKIYKVKNFTEILRRNFQKSYNLAGFAKKNKRGRGDTINCPKAVKDYNQFSHGVDPLGQRISCYNLDRKSKRNWRQMFIYFLNASICNSFICYNQLAQDIHGISSEVSLIRV